MTRWLSLRDQALIWCMAAFLIGLVAATLWTRSQAAWHAHLDRASMAGFALYNTLYHDLDPPTGLTARPLSGEEIIKAEDGLFAPLSALSHPVFTTNLSLRPPARAPNSDAFSGEALRLTILSRTLQYPVRDIANANSPRLPDQVAGVARLLATYCSDPVIIAQSPTLGWMRIEGSAIWGCEAAPRDDRLLAAAAAIIALAILLSTSTDASARFRRFAQTLNTRWRMGGLDQFDVTGPPELDQIVAAVNNRLEAEREQLAGRAMVLSGVSHDLGTPAMRLRLRTALIEDAVLRKKLDRDIDQMTGMIESVLTYTRSELSVETPRELSLTALVEALVADFQDVGQPVELVQAPEEFLEAQASVFSTRRARVALGDARRIVAIARPILLQRAISNLIENALKYGRRAHVSVSATADRAVIAIEDEGGQDDRATLDDLIGPFQRGANTHSVEGYGLGLTITDNVARQHGGRLWFERSALGLRACLEISRGRDIP